MSVNIVNNDGSLSRVAGGTLYSEMPVGTISPFGGSAIPSGYLLCNGQAVSRTTYADLFAIIGTAYGSGDGSTTFNIPDLREATTKGVGLSGKSNNHYDSDGVALGEFIEDRVQDHRHEVSVIPQSGGSQYIAGCSGGAISKSLTDYVDTTIATSTRKGATTEVKAVGVNYIIKAKQVAVPADFMDAIDDAIDESKPIEVTTTLDFNAYGNALITPPNGYKVISAIMPDHNWAFDVFYDKGTPYVHSRELIDYSAKITGTATLRLVYIKI